MPLPKELIATLITTLIGAVQFLLWKAKRREDRLEKSDELPAALQRDVSIGLALQELCDKTGGVRGMLLACHNGGARPRAGGQYYVSCRGEFADTSKIDRKRQELQRQPIYDPAYLDLVVKVQTENFVHFDVEGLPEDSWLRGVYAADNVAGAAVAEVVRKDDEYFYIAVQFLEIPEWTPALRGHVQSSAARLRHLLRELSERTV